jgi:hypothetical protein
MNSLLKSTIKTQQRIKGCVKFQSANVGKFLERENFSEYSLKNILWKIPM